MAEIEDFGVVFKKWMSWYDSEDQNCILKQVQLMLYDTLIYKTILKAREMAPEDKKGVIEVNGAMHWLLDKCFFTNQLMIIRRLTDSSSDARSLRKLLNTMRSNRKLLTRENYFSALDRYEYDYSETRKKCDEYVKEQERTIKFGECYFTPEDLDWGRSERMHCDFDILSKTGSFNRRPSDMISDVVFEEMIETLDSCQPLRDHIDHFIAHTLKKEKREKLDEEAVKITFEQLWKAQEIISSVTKFIGLYLLNRVDYGVLPLPHPSLLQYIEKPLVRKEQIVELRNVENDFRDEIQKWSVSLRSFST